jgi:phage terminase small subunit
MAALENARHEKFAQELSKGKTATEAYVIAGYKPNDGNAATLKGNQRILDRVAELQNAGSLRVEVTIASLIQEAADIQRAAQGAGQHSAAVAALTAKAKLAGLWVDKNENTNRNVDPARVTDAELAAVVQADSGPRVAAPKDDKAQPDGMVH